MFPESVAGDEQKAFARFERERDATGVAGAEERFATSILSKE
jgi:hypothetical protein